MKKLLAMLLILALMLSLTPAAFADETPEEPAPVEEAAAEEAAEDPAEAPEEEPEDPSAGPGDEEAGEPEAPADDTPPAGQEENLGTDGKDAEADDGPEYGVQPDEESPEPEEEKEEAPQEAQEDGEAEEPQSVLVTFLCDPADAVVTVYDGRPKADGTWTRIGTAADGTMLLAPGEYVYDASCEGWYTDSKIAFTVSPPDSADQAEQPRQTVTVELCPMDDGGFFEEEQALPLRSTPPDPLVVLPVEPDADRRTPTVYLQGDSRWAAVPYGYLDGRSAGTIAASGCGILALTNAVCYLNGIFIDPGFAAEYAAGAGFHVEGGTKWDFYRGFAETYGRTCGIQYAGEVYGYSELKNMLLRGCVAICSVPGHIMALVDYDEGLGRFLLLDSSPDDIRATGEGYVWISEQELSAMPSRVYDYNGLLPRFVLLRAVGVLDVSGLLDGVSCDSLDGYGTFDVWIDGDKVANDQTDYCAVLPRGASYRIDDIRAKGARRYYGVQEGALEGSIRSEAAAEVVLSFGTRDFVTEPDPESAPPPAGESGLPACCAQWAGGVIGPSVSIPFPKT